MSGTPFDTLRFVQHGDTVSDQCFGNFFAPVPEPTAAALWLLGCTWLRKSVRSHVSGTRVRQRLSGRGSPVGLPPYLSESFSWSIVVFSTTLLLKTCPCSGRMACALVVATIVATGAHAQIVSNGRFGRAWAMQARSSRTIPARRAIYGRVRLQLRGHQRLADVVAARAERAGRQRVNWPGSSHDWSRAGAANVVNVHGWRRVPGPAPGPSPSAWAVRQRGWHRYHRRTHQVLTLQARRCR